MVVDTVFDQGVPDGVAALVEIEGHILLHQLAAAVVAVDFTSGVGSALHLHTSTHFEVAEEAR